MHENNDRLLAGAWWVIFNSPDLFYLVSYILFYRLAKLLLIIISVLFILQMCNETAVVQEWSLADWFFTYNPGLFGLIPGIANPTGLALIFLITIMTIFSLPFVRKSGYFQVSAS